MKPEIKSVLVLARNDHLEAMRVAAGLTIVGHRVRLVFMARALSDADAESETAELLELCEIEPQTTVPEMREALAFLDTAELGAAIMGSDAVVNI